MKTFIGGIGCFWDEKKYEGIDGIISTECGYCGGDEPNVTYKAVCGGDTGHIQVVKVQYDEKKIAEKVLNEINKKLDGKVSTKVSKEKNYCKAEGYHQKYEKNKSLKFG